MLVLVLILRSPYRRIKSTGRYVVYCLVIIAVVGIERRPRSDIFTALACVAAAVMLVDGSAIIKTDD